MYHLATRWYNSHFWHARETPPHALVGRGGLRFGATAAAALVESTDRVLVSGRSSLGRGDHTVEVLECLGTVDFRGVGIGHAAPAAFGMIRGVPVVLLPGYPVACLFIYDFLARRAIRILGARKIDWPYARQPMRLDQPMQSPPDLLECVRARRSGD